MPPFHPILAFACALMAPSLALAVGGFESTDRPSEFRPALPGFKPKDPPRGFELPPVAEAAPAPGQPGPALRIRRIVIEGGTVFPAAELRALAQPYANRAVSVAELEELRQKLTQHYVEAGYINSGAIIPDQDFRDGVLRFVIVEGRLSEVRVKGQGNLRQSYIQDRLRGDPDQPFNIHALEDRFQALLSDPLISRMNGRILPGAAPGQGILDVDVARARPYRLSLYGDNFRPPSVGAEGFGVTGSLLSPFGFGEILDFTFAISSGTHRYTGGLSVPLNDGGTLAYFRFDEGDSVVVEAPFQGLDINSQVHSLEGGLSQTLIDTPRQRLSLGLLLATRQSGTSVLGAPFSFVPGVPGGRSQATVWRTYQDYLHRWDRHALAVRSTFSAGMDALGATPSRDGYPGSDFFAWLGQAQYAFRLGEDGARLVLRGNLQLANSPLLPLEKIALGGVSTVRGYRTNALVRDNGYALSAEAQYPLLRYRWWETTGQVSVIPFMDYGAAWNLTTSWAPYVKTASLWSVGAGLQWSHEPLLAEAFYGYALNRPERPRGPAFDVLQDNGWYFQVRLDVF
jgi:hemolysin activation/secretion protein